MGEGWILVCAGEVSGDQIAAPVVQALRRRAPELRCFGAGGERLEAAGVEVRHPVADLAVTGLTEALSRVGPAARLLLDLAREIRRRRPRLGLLVDYPGVNLRLAWLLRAAHVPVLYYVAPQRWAWLEWRAGVLRGLVDRLAVTLPFEEEWFRRRGVAATFVGHPVVDLFQPEPPAAGAPPCVALMPGSRPGEIRRHLPLLLQSLSLLPVELEPLLVTGSRQAAELCRALAPGLRQESSARALPASRVGLCASGTVTLEAALAGLPVVVLYRVSRLTYLVARRLVRVPAISLPNLVLGERLLPELIQDDATPSNLARAARRLLAFEETARVKAGLARVVERLGPRGAAERVADLALELV